MLPPAFCDPPAAGCWSSVPVDSSNCSVSRIHQDLSQRSPGDRAARSGRHERDSAEPRDRAHSTVPNLDIKPRDTHRLAGEVPSERDNPVGWQTPPAFRGAASRCVRAALVDLGAATLDQDAQHNDEEQACNNPDNRRTVHVESPFLTASFKFPESLPETGAA